LVDGTTKKSTEEATRATGGHTSGESAPRGVGQWHGTKADTPESWLLETLPRVGGDAHARVEIESLLAGVMARGGRDHVLDRLGAARAGQGGALVAGLLCAAR